MGWRISSRALNISNRLKDTSYFTSHSYTQIFISSNSSTTFLALWAIIRWNDRGDFRFWWGYLEITGKVTEFFNGCSQVNFVVIWRPKPVRSITSSLLLPAYTYPSKSLKYHGFPPWSCVGCYLGSVPLNGSICDNVILPNYLMPLAHTLSPACFHMNTPGYI